MALQLDKELNTGLTCDYWRVNSVVVDRDRDTMTVNVSLYKDAAARTAEKAPAYNTAYVVETSLADLQGADDPVELAYTKLKELDEFSEAEDV